MPHRGLAMLRAQNSSGPNGPQHVTMLAIAGDSAAGKTTITKGIVEAMGPERISAICVDDYHRYDRVERRCLPFTPLHPDCNYVDIMEQHLQLLALGQPILKPVYEHDTGLLGRPVLLEPSELVIVEGLLPLHSKLSRACFDVTVYLDPPEEIRRKWKVHRDTTERGYTEDQVLADLDKREPESEAHIRPQRKHADIVLRFAPIPERVAEHPDEALSATLLLRPTIPHPDLTKVLSASEVRDAVHLKLGRDEDGKPVDQLHIHGYAPREATRTIEEAIWSDLEGIESFPTNLGEIEPGVRSEPLALAQLLILYHLVQSRRG